MPESPLPADEVIAARLLARGVEVERIERLAGDVSVRSYARIFVRGGPSAILSYCPPSLRDACGRFLRTTELLGSVDVPTPRIVTADPNEGWILLEDLGERTVFDLGLAWPALARFYRDAVEAIRRIGTLDRDGVGRLSPPLDAAALRRELEQTWKLFLEPQGLAQPAGPAEVRAALDRVCDAIGDPLLPCHRDFMVRNLMPADDGRVVVIDHQDLRLGPRFYDLASLLNDSLFAPPDLEREMCSLLLSTDDDLVAYRRAALQRTLKAVGTFAAFYQRGNARHVPLIAPTLARAAALLVDVPETRHLAAGLAPRWRSWKTDDLLD